MSLLGSGAIAIWNGITPEGRANFYDWHGREHIPERVAIPGFLAGRRYVAEHGEPEFFTLYETANLQALTSAAYFARLNAPTDWTVRSTAHFRQVSRALCHVECSHGQGVGGLIATWRYEHFGDDDLHVPRMRQALAAAAARPGVAGAHFLITDRTASGIDTKERQTRGSANQIPSFVVLLEGWGDGSAFDLLCAEVASLFFESDELDFDFGVYRLQSYFAAGSEGPVTGV